MKTIILYGAGELGQLASQFFDFYNIEYIVCVDNVAKDKINPSFDIDNVTNIKDVSCIDNPLVLVCISTLSYDRIMYKLNNLGFNNILPFFQYAEQIQKENGYEHPLTNGWKHNYKFSKRKIQKVAREFYPNFLSYHSYFQFFNWHKTYEECYINLINCNDRYFIPEVISVLHDHEVFVDVGAYDGRVSKQFIEIVGDKFKGIYLFEPDNYNFRLMVKNIQHRNGIYWNQCALANNYRHSRFLYNYGYLSKLYKDSKNKAGLIKLDDMEISPTFIKIHIEGYELEAIKGSIKTIKKHRPILAVTTYHTEEGLYKLPIYLIKNLKDYNFYWRNHNYQGQGAVMYCIPKERSKLSIPIREDNNWITYKYLKEWMEQGQ